MKIVNFLRCRSFKILMFTALALIFLTVIFILFYLSDTSGYQIYAFSPQVPTARRCAVTNEDYFYISGGKVYDKAGSELISEGNTYSLAVSGENIFYVNGDRICRYNLKSGKSEALEAGLLYKGMAAHNGAVFAKAEGNIYQHWIYRADKEIRYEEEEPFPSKDKVTVSETHDGYRFFANDDTLEYSAVIDEEGRIITRGLNGNSLLYIDSEKIITSYSDRCTFRIYGADGRLLKTVSLPDGYHYLTSNIYAENGKIYMLAQKQNGYTSAGYYNLPGRLHISDKVMTFDGENFETLYEAPKKERIVGFNGKDFLIAKGRRLFTSDGKEIGKMQKSKNYIFEQCGGRVFVWNEDGDMINTYEW